MVADSVGNGVHKDLLVRVAELKGILVACATGKEARDEDYRSLRENLLANPGVRAALPYFVESCRSLADFWDFIKPISPTYAGRREFLRRQFDPVLTMLEEEARAEVSAPSDDAVTETLTRVNWRRVQESWRKAIERRSTDPQGAITAARTLLEDVCKHILDEMGVGNLSHKSLTDLYHATAQHLSLAPDRNMAEPLRRMLGGSFSVVEGIGALRNFAGDAHGREGASPRADVRHAEFAVSLAGAVASFLIQSYEAWAAGASGHG